jgi:hypothetical protein
MIYNATQEKVYSVGPDLVDDGGSIDDRKATDIGLSLRASVKR